MATLIKLRMWITTPTGELVGGSSVSLWSALGLSKQECKDSKLVMLLPVVLISVFQRCFVPDIWIYADSWSESIYRLDIDTKQRYFAVKWRTYRSRSSVCSEDCFSLQEAMAKVRMGANGRLNAHKPLLRPADLVQLSEDSELPAQFQQGFLRGSASPKNLLVGHLGAIETILPSQLVYTWWSVYKGNALASWAPGFQESKRSQGKGTPEAPDEVPD